MSLRDLIKNASPELLKSSAQRGELYQALADVTEAFQALKERVADLESRDEEIKSLKGRIDALEEGGIRYRGIYQRAQPYSKGDVVTFNGCAWIALRSLKETEEPGTCDGWMLMVKKGRDA
ncbi:hypothetical protein [Brucella sp. 2280]|uniref:hypothetical protein n=1 Tax=Brucella sp. 2280 TaxID=2592625 RepID=UPI001296F0B2|nr:hypothetical protein [Brucella sp. 2280]QGA56881.1 hypothetical protein GHC20_07250 [Brucella sp. 2280]